MKWKEQIIKLLGGYTLEEYNNGLDHNNLLLLENNKVLKQHNIQLNNEINLQWRPMCVDNQKTIAWQESRLTLLEPFNESQPLILVDNKEITSTIRSTTRKHEVLDGFYTIPTLEELKAFLSYDKTNRRVWTEENYDCDNFSIDLWSNAKRWNSRVSVGMCTITLPTYRHAINFAFVEHEGEIRLVFIEPQNDGIYFDKYPKAVRVDNMII